MPIDYLLYTDEVEAKDIRKLVVEAFVVNENMELVKHLLNAWCAAWQAETDKDIPGFTGIGYDDQYARYAFYKSCYEKAFGNEVDEGIEPDWPEDCFLPKWFIKQVAVIEAQRHKASIREYARMHKEMDKDERSMTADQFKSKWGFVSGYYTEQAEAG